MLQNFLTKNWVYVCILLMLSLCIISVYVYINRPEKAVSTQVSPFGFGPYPEVPEGFPSNIRIPWLMPIVNRTDETEKHKELAVRVLIKLWNQGVTNFTGVTITSNQMVFPHYPNTAYVNYSEKKLDNGKTVKTISGIFGGPDLGKIDSEMLATEDIPGFRIIEENEGAIDPYKFLKLRRK